MLGSNSSTSRTFLSVGFGKIRQKQTESGKVTENTPGAVCRETQSGLKSWALEHDFITGTITNIFYKEDPNYGNSFEVVISDCADEYQLSFSDDSRYWFDLAKKLPNADLKEPVKINVFDFKDKNGKRHIGTSLIQNEQKIASFYQTYNESGIFPINGYPETPQGMDWKDKDSVKMYTILVKKFLKTEVLSKIVPKLQLKEENIPVVKEPEPEENDDLPF